MKPSKLIELLERLLAETEKINIGKIYIAIIEETNSIRFVETSNPFSDLVYKYLIRLSIKDYIHSSRSDASANVIQDVIRIISDAEITN